MTWSEIADFFGAARYAQHAICLTNDPLIMMLYVAADLTTFVSYIVIGLSLIIKRAHRLEFSTSALTLFGSFIFLCGLSHATEVITLFSGVYRLDVAISVMMASVSAITAVFTAVEIYGFRVARQ